MWKLTRFFNIFIALLIVACSGSAEYDLIVRNGRIVDGSGAPWFSGQVALCKGITP